MYMVGQSFKMENYFLLQFIGILCCTLLVSQVAGWNVTDEQRLMSDLFLSNSAESLVMVRPPGSHGTNQGINVSVSYDQITIHEVDELSGYITLSMWESLRWKDTRLAWSEEEYGGVNKISVLPKYIWLPDLSAYAPSTSTVSGLDDHVANGIKAIINSDGSISYIHTRTVRFHCNMDMSNFPFDTQSCKFTLGSWVHHVQEIRFIGYEFGTVNVEFEAHHTDWKTNHSVINSHITTYECCPDQSYQSLELTIGLIRKPQFYYYIFLVPAATINIVLPFLHFFPPTSSQKTTTAGLLLVCSMLLHLMLYGQLRGFAEEKTPILLEYMESQLTVIVMSIVISSITSSLATVTHTSCRLPGFIRKVVEVIVGRVCCFGRAETKNDFTRLEEMNQNIQFETNNDSVPIVDNEVTENTERDQHNLQNSLQVLSEEMRNTRKRRHLEKEWYQLALIIDRLVGIIYIIYTIVIFARYGATEHRFNE